MNIDYASGIVLSNGDLLEATYEEKWGCEYITKTYTGCIITKPNGDKIWNANSWYSHIEGMEPLKTDIF